MKEYKRERIISFFISLLVIPYIAWEINNSQTRDFVEKRPILKVPFSVFLKEFLKVDWILRPKSPNSLFTELYWDSEIHAGIIKINKIGYNLTIYGRLKFYFIKRKTIKALRRKTKFPPTYEYKYN